MARLPLQTNARAGTIALVAGYRTSVGLQLGTLYRARPEGDPAPSVPFVFIDRIAENADSFTREESQRSCTVHLRVVWGKYNTGQAVDQRDRFVDGFYAWVMDHPDEFGGNAVVYWRTVSDDPDWLPDWLPDSPARLFMTEITLEGQAAT